MIYRIEEPIQIGMRALAFTQEAFSGAAVLPRKFPGSLALSWYGTQLSALRGSFCMVKEDAGFEDLTGEFIRLVYGTRSLHVYCLGETPLLETDIGIPRNRFLEFAYLPTDSIDVFLDVLQ